MGWYDSVMCTLLCDGVLVHPEFSYCKYAAEADLDVLEQAEVPCPQLGIETLFHSCQFVLLTVGK
jgi:hypothetical protein